ncbi:hypothetical protein MRX96_039057 [Rhipicephalus microplus]
MVMFPYLSHTYISLDLPGKPVEKTRMHLLVAVAARRSPRCTWSRRCSSAPSPSPGYETWSTCPRGSTTTSGSHRTHWRSLTTSTSSMGRCLSFAPCLAVPDMTGPGNRQYLWFDEKGKKCKVAAPQYIDYVMTFTQKTVNDESLFPTKFEREFPSSFESLVKKIHGLLLHVLAHLYHAHFREMVLLQLHGHLHSIFAHFTLFNTRFNLVDPKDAAVLQDLAVALGLCPPAESANGSPAASSSTPTSSAVAAGGSTDEDSAAVDAPACTAAPMDVSLSPSVMQRSVVTTGIATTPLSMTTTPAGSVVPAQ